MNKDLLQTQCDFSPMKSAVKANLTELSEEIHRIVDALDHEEEYSVCFGRSQICERPLHRSSPRFIIFLSGMLSFSLHQ